MFDFLVSGLDFSSTKVTVKAVSEKGLALCAEAFAPGACGAEFRKSEAGAFLAHIEAKGLKYGEA